MDRCNFLAFIVSITILIACTSKEHSIQAYPVEPPDGFVRIGDKSFYQLYMKETEDQYIYWAISGTASGGTSVYAINKCKTN